MHDQYRTVRGAEVADIAQPVGQALIAEDQALIGGFVLVLGFGRPDQQEDRAGAQEQRVRAVIQVLAAEIPDVQPGGRRIAGVQFGGGDLDAVGGRCGVVIGFVAQPPANLGPADAAVA